MALINMRKLIAILSIATLAIVACNKKSNTSGDSFNDTGTSKYQTMTDPLTVGQMHNVIMEVLEKKNVFKMPLDNEADAKSVSEIVAFVSDSLFSAGVSADSLMSWNKQMGIFNPDGTIKTDEEIDALFIAMPANKDISTAFANIFSTTLTGEDAQDYVNDQVGSLTLSGSDAGMMDGFISIYNSSVELNNVVYIPMTGTPATHIQAWLKINERDAAGYAQGWLVGEMWGWTLAEKTYNAICTAAEFSAYQAIREHRKGNI